MKIFYSDYTQCTVKLRSNFQKIAQLHPYLWILEKIQKPGTELASFLEKNPTKIQKLGFWELSQRHIWKKNPEFFHEYSIMIFEKLFFGNWASVIFGKKSTKKIVWKVFWIFFSKMTLTQFPKIGDFINSVFRREITQICRFWGFFP